MSFLYLVERYSRGEGHQKHLADPSGNTCAPIKSNHRYLSGNIMLLVFGAPQAHCWTSSKYGLAASKDLSGMNIVFRITPISLHIVKNICFLLRPQSASEKRLTTLLLRRTFAYRSMSMCSLFPTISMCAMMCACNCPRFKSSASRHKNSLYLS